MVIKENYAGVCGIDLLTRFNLYILEENLSLAYHIGKEDNKVY
jgi:hypothetical protein